MCEHCLFSLMLKTTRGYLELNTEVRLGAVVCCDGSFKLGAFHGVCFEVCHTSPRWIFEPRLKTRRGSRAPVVFFCLDNKDTLCLVRSLFCISKFSIFIEVDLNFGALCIDFQLLKKMRALHAGRRVWL
ncbi:hypothetical protein U1Q18_040342 [Sarracenia purpurea var. burkii]